MRYEEGASVPLSDELTGSLRTVVPKGLPVSERAARLRDRGLLADPAFQRRKRKVHEKPHKPRALVWHPKYKLPHS
jgi:hypothetical protein